MATGGSTEAASRDCKAHGTALGSRFWECRPHPLGRRTTCQTAVVTLGAAQARRECSRSASTLGVGQYAARSKPAFAGRRIGRRAPEN